MLRHFTFASRLFGLLTFTSVALAAEFSTYTNAPQAQHTRVLAASCAACHGTNGNSADITPTLAGLEASYFTTQMLAFKNGARESTVMHHHAKGLTADEINTLAVYFSEQARVTSPALQPQALKTDHD